MEHNYMLNPAIAICVEYIENGSAEKEVQQLWDNMLITVFPAQDNWMFNSRYRGAASEPDNVIRKLLQYNAGWAPVDVLVVELKRLQEDVSKRAFDKVADSYLDDMFEESTNKKKTILFGAVGIGEHVQFYEYVLPKGPRTAMHSAPYHLIRDAQSVQQYFNYFKVNVAKSAQGPALQATSGTPVSSVPSAGYGASSGSGASSSAPPATYTVSYGSGEASIPQRSESPSPTSTGHLPDRFIFVVDGEYWLNDNGNTTSTNRPGGEQWVYNEMGWKATNREFRWRRERDDRYK
jgi:hypothetical protein